MIVAIFSQRAAPIAVVRDRVRIAHVAWFPMIRTHESDTQYDLENASSSCINLFGCVGISIFGESNGVRRPNAG